METYGKKRREFSEEYLKVASYYEYLNDGCRFDSIHYWFLALTKCRFTWGG